MINRRQFTTAAAAALYGGTCLASTADNIIHPLSLLTKAGSLPCQNTFRELCGLRFQARGAIAGELCLTAVEPARKNDTKQFYLRFNSGDRAMPEGIYQLRFRNQELTLFLSPSAGNSRQLEAVINYHIA